MAIATDISTLFLFFACHANLSTSRDDLAAGLVDDAVEDMVPADEWGTKHRQDTPFSRKARARAALALLAKLPEFAPCSPAAHVLPKTKALLWRRVLVDGLLQCSVDDEDLKIFGSALLLPKRMLKVERTAMIGSLREGMETPPDVSVIICAIRGRPVFPDPDVLRCMTHAVARYATHHDLDDFLPRA